MGGLCDHRKIHRSGEGKGRREAIGEIQSEGVDG